MTRRQQRVARVAAKRPRHRREPEIDVVLTGPEKNDPAVLDEIAAILCRWLDNPPAKA